MCSRVRPRSTCAHVLLVAFIDVCECRPGFEHIVWMGDLNYRLDFPSEVWGDGVYAKSPPQNLFNHVRKCAEECEYTEMMKHDQLRAAIASGDAFIGFSESDPTFKPTFKVFVSCVQSLWPALIMT